MELLTNRVSLLPTDSIFLFAVRCVIHAGIVLAVALVAARTLRRTSAALRHLILMTSQVVTIVIPIVAILIPDLPLLPRVARLSWPIRAEQTRDAVPPRSVNAASQARTTKSELPSGATPSAAGLGAHPATTTSDLSDASRTHMSSRAEHGLAQYTNTGEWPKISVTLMFALVWCLGSCLLAVRLAASMVGLRVCARRANVPVSPRVMRAFEKTRHQMTPSRRCRLVVSEQANMPMVWGMRQPIVSIPRQVPEGSDQTLQSVLRHELAHVRRHDPLTRMIGQLCTVVYWFNPLAWLALWQLAELAEHASDDMVLEQGIAAAEYAEHLLSVVRHSCSRPRQHLALSMSTPSQLRRRIAAVLDDGVNRQVPPRWETMGFLAIGFVLALPVTAISQKTPAPSAKREAGQQDRDPRTNAVKSQEKPSSERRTKDHIRDSAPIVWERQRVAGVRVVRGRVVDAKGQPVPNIDVGLRWETFHEELSANSLVITDSLGQFELPVDRSTVLIAMDKARENGAMAIVNSSDGASPQTDPLDAPIEIEIALVPLVDVRGSYRTDEVDRRPRSAWTSVQKLPEEVDVISQMDNSPFFSFRLPPARYRLRGNAADFEDVYREFVVDPATGPLSLLDLPMSLGKRARLYEQPAPEIHITRGLGIDTTAKLSDYRGKWVVLKFWGVWCGPCIRDMGQLMLLAQRHTKERERFEIITIHHDIPEQKRSLEEALPELVKRWHDSGDLDRDEFPFPIAIDATRQTVEAYGVDSFPTSVFIDPEGRVANIPGVWGLSDILKGRAEPTPGLFQATGPDAVPHPPVIRPSDSSEGIVGQRCVAFNGHTDMVGAVSFLPDGKHFITSASDNTLRFWNVATRDQARLIRCTPEGSGISSYGIQVYIAQQGKLVGGNFYDYKDGGIVHFPRFWSADSDYQQSISLSDPGVVFGKADISADGELFAADAYSLDDKAESVRIYDLAAGTLSHELDVDGDRKGDSSTGSALKFSPDGRHLAVAGARGHSIQVWDVLDARKLWEAYPSDVFGINSISFAPDGNSFAYAGWHEPLEFRATTTGELLRTLESPGHRIVVASISPSGRYVATAANNPRPRIKIWDIGSGSIIGTLTGHATGARADAIAWSPDERYIVTVAGRQMNQPGEVLLWDLVENGIIQSP